MKVAVIGAGIFGATAAIKLAEAGFQADLFEKESDILQAASGINQYRLHRGYHYPRSEGTIEALRLSQKSFLAEYGEAVLTGNEHYYCIAKEKSKTSADQFLAICKKWGLPYKEVTLKSVNPAAVSLTLRVDEALIDPEKLRSIVRRNIKSAGVNLLLNTLATPALIKPYDLVINCTYANLNWIDDNSTQLYQFEVCEKPVLKLPAIFRNQSIVVLDGPFMCIDPLGDTGLHVMGNVVHAIHATNTGLKPIIPDSIAPLLNKGIVKNPPITKIKSFIESATYFMPEVKAAEHIGSMFTVRTVLPNVDSTDERPTIVRKVNERLISIFSGKIGNCVQAAEEVVRLAKTAPRSSR